LDSQPADEIQVIKRNADGFRISIRAAFPDHVRGTKKGPGVAPGLEAVKAAGHLVQFFRTGLDSSFTYGPLLDGRRIVD
jgi:hypothetical protein